MGPAHSADVAREINSAAKGLKVNLFQLIKQLLQANLQEVICRFDTAEQTKTAMSNSFRGDGGGDMVTSGATGNNSFFIISSRRLVVFNSGYETN